MSTLQPTLHKDAAFILTAMLRLFENKPDRSMLVPRAIGLNMIPFLMHVLEEADMNEVGNSPLTRPHLSQHSCCLLYKSCVCCRPTFYLCIY